MSEKITVKPQNSGIPKSTLFALTKMSLFWYVRNFGKNTLIFKAGAQKYLFFIIFEKLCYTGLNLMFLWQFLALIYLQIIIEVKSSRYPNIEKVPK